MDEDNLLTPVEVAAMLQVQRRFVYAEVAAGRLPALKLSARVMRIRRGDVERYLAAGRVLSPADLAADK